MSRMALRELLPDVAGVPAGLVVSGLVQDSREVGPGDAFIAIPGFGTHGLRFSSRALDAGAAAIVYEIPAPEDLEVPADAIAVPGLRSRLGAMADRFHGSPSKAMVTVGVTGTNGKTSTVQLLAQAWTLRGLRAGSIGTLGAGLHGAVEPTGFTTPQVSQLHALLARLRDDGAQAVAMEVSSHALDQGRVDGVHFRVGVFTNLTRDHLDYHGDMASYGAAKARLLRWPGLEAAVVNLDDPYGLQLFESGHAGRTIGISTRGHPAALLRAESVALDGAGIGFRLCTGEAEHPVRSPLLGRFNVDNLLAVAGVLHALGEDAATIADTLSRLQPVPGRMTRLGGAGRPTVVVDYAHTPDALEQALASLRDHVRGRLVCVFGCGGERDRGKRAQMAAIAERLADAVVVTDDNPRSEDPAQIFSDIRAGFASADKVTFVAGRSAAIAQIIANADAEDVIVLAGKGHEDYQEINGERHDFSDLVEAEKALNAWEAAHA